MGVRECPVRVTEDSWVRGGKEVRVRIVELSTACKNYVEELGYFL
jgi:hypothetical protein